MADPRSLTVADALPQARRSTRGFVRPDLCRGCQVGRQARQRHEGCSALAAEKRQHPPYLMKSIILQYFDL
jgi:hypothetical protein